MTDAERISELEAKLAEAERPLDSYRLSNHELLLARDSLRAQLAEAERERDEALQRAETAESVQASMILVAEHAQDALAAAESREKALATDNKALREALLDAARSLEWMARVQPPTEDQPSTSDLRQYAASRARVVRAALAAGKEET